jgi:hypothetical protein
MSFDIDVILRAQARKREAVDRIKALLSTSFAYQPDKDKSFRYQKTIDGNPIQLDLLADVARIKEDEVRLEQLWTLRRQKSTPRLVWSFS